MVKSGALDKGYIQLCMRTGAYRYINADVVYEGELVKNDKLTGEIEIDPEQRTSNKKIGYFAFIETLNGFRKTLYMTVDEVTKDILSVTINVPNSGTVLILASGQFDDIGYISTQLMHNTTVLEHMDDLSGRVTIMSTANVGAGNNTFKLRFWADGPNRDGRVSVPRLAVVVMKR